MRKSLNLLIKKKQLSNEFSLERRLKETKRVRNEVDE